MKRLALMALLLLALVALSATVLAQDTLEAGVTTGTLGSEPDNYTLTAAAGDVYVISLESKQFDAYLTVLDSTDDQVAFDDDSGADRDSLLLFAPVEDGAYTVRVSSFDGSGGDYTLTVIDTFAALELGTAADVSFDSGSVQVFSVVAPEDPVNIVIDSGNTVDTSLIVLSADRMDYFREQSHVFDGADPALNRVLFTTAGNTYYVLVVREDATAKGSVSLLVEETTIDTLGAEPLTFEFSGNLREDVVTFDVEEGQEYVLSVTVDVPSDFNVYISAAAQDEYAYANFSFTNGLGGTWRYVPDYTGTLIANISGGYFSFNESATYTLSLTTVSEE